MHASCLDCLAVWQTPQQIIPKGRWTGKGFRWHYSLTMTLVCLWILSQTIGLSSLPAPLLNSQITAQLETPVPIIVTFSLLGSPLFFHQRFIRYLRSLPAYQIALMVSFIIMLLFFLVRGQGRLLSTQAATTKLSNVRKWWVPWVWGKKWLSSDWEQAKKTWPKWWVTQMLRMCRFRQVLDMYAYHKSLDSVHACTDNLFTNPNIYCRGTNKPRLQQV